MTSLLPDGISTLLFTALELMAAFFIFAIGTTAAVVLVMYFVDRNQTKQTIRRNYPVIGRFRYLFEHIGEFFRQYFFAMDREELPFNRAQRSWIYRAAKNIDSTVAFGSSKDLTKPGSIIFVNTPYPTLDQDAVECAPVTIGPQCDTPFSTKSIVNISGMSLSLIHI